MASYSQDSGDSSYKTTFENMRMSILESLGYPLVKVELTETQLNRSIIEAAQEFSRYYGFDYKYELAIPYDRNKVTLPDGVDPEHIFDVIFENDSIGQGVGGGNIFQSLKVGGEILAIPFQTRAFDDLNLSSYIMWLQNLEDIKKVFGISRHWEILNGIIHIYPSSEVYSRVAIMCADIPPLERLDQEPWIRQYALAKAKTILGMIRRKFSSLQMPGGGLALDGNELIAEGKEEMAKLMEEIQFHRRPLPIVQI